MKKCTKCGEPKERSEFPKRGDSQCKLCKNAAARVWRAANQERVRQLNKAWHAAHPERAKVLNQEWHSINPEGTTGRNARWRKLNPVRSKALSRRAGNKRYADNKLRCMMSRGIGKALRRVGSSKAGRSAMELVPYTIEDLRGHLSLQFKPGMSWENYGEWHVDHIRPISSFNFSAPVDPDFMACWSLSNLQPLWAKDNIRKGARYQ